MNKKKEAKIRNATLSTLKRHGRLSPQILFEQVRDRVPSADIHEIRYCVWLLMCAQQVTLTPQRLLQLGELAKYKKIRY